MATTKSKTLSGNNFLIIMALVTLLVVGGTVMVGQALVKAALLDHNVLDAKKHANDNLLADLDAAPQLVKSYQDLGKDATMLANALPNVSDLPGLLVVLENMASTTGIKLKSVTPSLLTTDTAAKQGGPTQAPSPQTYQFSVQFDGTYENLQKFLKDVELSARPMRVVSVQMTGNGSSLSGEVGIQTYYQAKAQLPFGKETIK